MKRETLAEQRQRVINERVNNPEVVKKYLEAVFGETPKKTLSVDLMESVITLTQHSQGVDNEN